jgi:hypothetical protein
MNLFTQNQNPLPGLEYKDNLKSISFVASVFEVSETTVRDWADESIIEKPVNGQVDLLSVVRRVYRHQRNLIAGTGTEKLTTQRADLLSIKKEIGLLELEKLRGKLLDAEKVKRVALSRATIEAHNLESIPARLKSILAAETNEYKIEQILKRELEIARSNILDQVQKNINKGEL